MKNNKFLKIAILTVVLLISIIAKSQTASKQLGDYYYYYPKLNKELLDVDFAKNKLKEFILKQKYIRVYNKEETLNFLIKEVLIYEDRMEFIKGKNKISLTFEDLIGSNVTVNEHIWKFSGPGENITYCNVFLKNVRFFADAGKSSVNDCPLSIELAKYFKAIQHYYFWQKANEDLEKFKSVAMAYNKLATKPSISEEQRKYIVQANSLTEQKLYEKAIELNVQAIQLNITSYPSGYSNIALMQAQIGSFDQAIFEMKKYLLLMPDALDAREAQDKIYEWEMMLME